MTRALKWLDAIIGSMIAGDTAQKMTGTYCISGHVIHGKIQRGTLGPQVEARDRDSGTDGYVRSAVTDVTVDRGDAQPWFCRAERELA